MIFASLIIGNSDCIYYADTVYFCELLSDFILGHLGGYERELVCGRGASDKIIYAGNLAFKLLLYLRSVAHRADSDIKGYGEAGVVNNIIRDAVLPAENLL